MIVVDTSALIAILGGEDGSEPLKRAISLASRVSLSTGTAVEAFIVVRSKWGKEGAERLERMLSEAKIELRDMNEAQMRSAVSAYARFGRGSGSPAKLNFGDCFSYALADVLDAPLLFKGADFAETDIRSAVDAFA